MNDAIQIPTCGRVVGSIRPPGSKSITNRALICAALAEGDSLLRGALDSEDTQVMTAALARLGFEVDARPEQATIAVGGRGGVIPADAADLMIGNSGTTIRFLTSMLTLGAGRYRLDGIARMRRRPIGDLLAALRELGGRAAAENKDDCPPVLIEAAGLAGGRTKIRGDISSQFLSGLLMACPYARQDVAIEVDGPLVSQPYVEMTLRGDAVVRNRRSQRRSQSIRDSRRRRLPRPEL